MFVGLVAGLTVPNRKLCAASENEDGEQQLAAVGDADRLAGHDRRGGRLGARLRVSGRVQVVHRQVRREAGGSVGADEEGGQGRHCVLLLRPGQARHDRRGAARVHAGKPGQLSPLLSWVFSPPRIDARRPGAQAAVGDEQNRHAQDYGRPGSNFWHAVLVRERKQSSRSLI